MDKLVVDDNLDYVLERIVEDRYHIGVLQYLNIILSLNNKYVCLDNSIVINQNLENEKIINFENHDILRKFKADVLDRYVIYDINKIKNYIKHFYSSYLLDSNKSNLGKYYTPEEIVDYVKVLLSDKIDNDVYLLDTCCGCGAFLGIFDKCQMIGRDIDEDAISILKLLGIDNVELDNSLYNVNREKYGLKEDDKLIIIGNPPYNDITSKNKRDSINKKIKVEMDYDDDIKTKDLGRMFLLSYAKLNPEYICVIHPLSYLIKKANFNSLKGFSEKYILETGMIYSSHIFPDLKSNRPFPVVLALYKKGSMTYDYILNFDFGVYDRTNYKFKLSGIETIDTLVKYDNSNNIFIKAGKNTDFSEVYIRKYPKKLDRISIEKSDIDLYMYNIRDINSLMSSGNVMYFSDNEHLSYITINYNDLYKFAYLNMFKHYFRSDYLTGNLSPLVDIDELENNQELKDLFIIGFILKNRHRLKPLDVDNNDSLLYTKNIINDYIYKSSHYIGECNIYKLFLDNIENISENTDEIYTMIKKYFDTLYKKYLY